MVVYVYCAHGHVILLKNKYINQFDNETTFNILKNNQAEQNRGRWVTSTLCTTLDIVKIIFWHCTKLLNIPL